MPSELYRVIAVSGYRERIKLALILAALAAIATIGEGQQAKIHHVVIFSSGDPGNNPGHPLIVGLRDGLKEAGYVERKNLVLSVPENKT